MTQLATGAFLSDNVKVRATQSEKEAKDFQRAKDIMDHLDIFYGDYRDYDKIKKIKINFDLLNGRLDPVLYEDPLCFSVAGEEISFDFSNISHTPLVSQFGNAIIGEMNNRPFRPMIKDNTPNRQTLLKQRSNKVLSSYIAQSIVGPIRNQILNDILRQAGQTDIFNMASSPEQQLQLEQEVNSRLVQELPRDVLEFINGTAQSPVARQAQKMIDFLIDKYNIRFETIKGFKNAVCTGEIYFFAGEYDGGLYFEATNPAFITWGGGDRENQWVQNADWVKRERWLSYQQIVSRHSKYLTEKELEIIDLDVEPVGGFSKGTEFWDREAMHTKKLMWEYSADEGFRDLFSDINIKTKEGRRKLFNMYDVAFSRFGDKYGVNYSDYGIRESHFQWRDLRKMWIVKRFVDGRMKEFWLPEHYEPTHLDTDIRVAWMNEVWEGWKLGTFDCAYVNIRRLPYQYKSVFNPHDVDLSYYGKKLNTHDNLTENIALIDLGKSAQKNFDMVLASVRHDMSTNIGSAFTMFMNMKPEAWTYQDWLDLLRNVNILMLDPTRQMSGIDPQFFKQINLSKMADIAGKIQLLEFYRNQIAMSMYFNDVREGAISQYANTQNVQQNTIAVHNKTAFFFEQHRLVVEKALGGFLNRARHYYRENPEEAAVFLDDVSLAHLEASPVSWYEWLGVFLQNSQLELQQLETLKSHVLAFIQNQTSVETVMELIFADTQSEVKDIVRRETERMEKARQEQMQMQQQMQTEQLQAQAAEKTAEREHDLFKHMSELESQEKRTLWDREKFAMQNDIDKNNVHDLIQKTMTEIAGKLKLQEGDIQVEREKMQLMEKIEAEKLKVQKTAQNKKTLSIS